MPCGNPLRRHSSSPSSLLLDSCLSKVTGLSQRVDRVFDSLQGTSLGELDRANPDSVVDWILDTILSLVVQEGECNMVKSRQCHHCHRPISHPEHAGIGSGVNLCTLGHYELCPGGRRTSPDWTGCPASATSSEEETESEEKTNEVDKVADLEYREGVRNDTSKVNPILPAIDAGALARTLMLMTGPSKEGMLDASAVAKSIMEAAGIAERVELDCNDGDDESSDNEDDILLSEIEQLKNQVKKAEEEEAKQQQAKAKADRREQKRLNRKRLEEEKADLIRRTKKVVFPPQLLPSQDTSADQLQKKAAELAARQQKHAADRHKLGWSN